MERIARPSARPQAAAAEALNNTTTEARDALENLQRLRALIAGGGRAQGVRQRVGNETVFHEGPAGTLALDATPEPKAVFSTLRTMLRPQRLAREDLASGDAEQLPVSTAVASAALTTTAEAVPWLLRWYAKQTHQGRFQGPGHAGHVVLGCLASTLPAVVDCLGIPVLQDSALSVLLACVNEQRTFPEVGPIMIDQVCYVAGFL
ncbi:unnamed protein product [Phaeothamnion confervicola]